MNSTKTNETGYKEQGRSRNDISAVKSY